MEDRQGNMKGNEKDWWNERRKRKEIAQKVRCTEMASRRKSVQRKVDRQKKA
jgi:hypothetical protein